MNRPVLAARPYRAFPLVVKVLLAANVAMFLAQIGGYDGLLTRWLALWPAGGPEYARLAGRVFEIPQFYPWQLLTYGFLHGGVMHLFFNLFALWMFGVQIENLWGAQRFLLYYLVCVVGAGLVQLLVVSLEANSISPTLGASGGVFGVLLAYGMMFPERRVMLLFPPIPMKAKWFVIVYGVLELTFGVTGGASGIAHFAHLGGMLFGFGMIRYWRSRRG